MKLAGPHVLPDHLDDAPAGIGRHARMIGVRRRDRGRAGQRHAERLGGARHGRGGAHRHAVAGRTGDRFLHVLPLRSVMLPARFSSQYFQLSLPLPSDLTAPAGVEHRPRGHEDAGQVHAEGAHQEARRGLVAAAHQHRAVDRDARAAPPPSRWRAGCGRASWSASSSARSARSPAPRWGSRRPARRRASPPPPAA